MLIQTTNKMDCIKAFINMWIKDPTWYCNTCGSRYGVEQPKPPFTCCEEPQIGRNIDHTKGVIEQNKKIRETRNNDFGSNNAKTIRWGVSLPPALLADLERYFRKHYDMKLFETPEEMQQFARKFPVFATCKRV